MSPEHQPIIIIVSIGIVILLSFAVALVVFLLAFQRKKVAYFNEKQRLQAEFQQELLQSSLEIQESTHQMIGRELHDNIGQILAVVRLYLSSIQEVVSGPELEKATKAETLTLKAIQDVRAFSHTLDAHKIDDKGLLPALQELARQVTQTGKMQCEVVTQLTCLQVQTEHTIILFRICQELISNAIRHSGGNRIVLNIWETSQSLCIDVIDDGKGYATEQTQHGNGWTNIQNRIQLLTAHFEIESQTGKGTVAHIVYPLIHEEKQHRHRR